MKENVLVISTHPDDEALGCGGTILKYKAQNVNVSWLIITEEKQMDLETVSKRFGFSSVFNLDFLSMELDNEKLSSLIKKVKNVFDQVKPTTIFLPNRTDAHSDHRVTFNAVMACAKSFRAPYIKKILMYECISETEFAPALPENIFIPNYYIDISAYLKEKISILNIYQSEMGEHPFPRSERNVEALAIFRGAIAGVEYAEAFQLIKFIDK